MSSPSNLSWADFGSDAVSWADTTDEPVATVAKSKAEPEPVPEPVAAPEPEPVPAVEEVAPEPQKAGNPWGRASEEDAAATPAKVAPKLRGAPTPAEAALQEQRESAPQSGGGAYAPPRRQGDGGYGGRDGGYGGRDGGRDGGYGGRDGGYGGRDGGYGRRDGGYGGRDGGYGGRDGGYGGRGHEEEQRGPPQLPSGPPFKAFMGNLDFNVSEQDVFEFMGVPEDGVVDIAVPRDPNTDRPRGFAIVEFKSVEGLKHVLTLHQTTLMNRAVRVDVSQGRERRDEPSRAETADNWRSAPRRQFDAAPPRRGAGADGGDNFDRQRRDDRYQERDGGESWLGRPRQVPVSHAHQPAQRPKLVLKPRSKPMETVGAPVQTSSASDPFGGAKPRDEGAYQKRVQEERKKRGEERKQREEERKQREEERKQCEEERKQCEEERKQCEGQAKGADSDSQQQRKSDRYQPPRRTGERGAGRDGRRENSRFDKSWGSSTGERRQAWNAPRSRQRDGASSQQPRSKDGWNTAPKQHQAADTEKEASSSATKEGVTNRFEALAVTADQ
jgi:RNA recognition motif-containing protein